MTPAEKELMERLELCSRLAPLRATVSRAGDDVFYLFQKAYDLAVVRAAHAAEAFLAEPTPPRDPFPTPRK